MKQRQTYPVQRTTGPFSVAIALIVGTAILGLASCTPSSSETGFSVTATTTLLSDLVVELTEGTAIQTHALMTAGVDPHGYKASTGDVERLAASNLVIFHGLELEAKMEDLLHGLGPKAVQATAEIPTDRLLAWEGGSGVYDPHVWNDAGLWMIAAQTVAKTLQERVPESAAIIGNNLTTLLATMETTDSWAREAVATVAPEKRRLVTSHDAFAYLARRYGIEARAIQGISTQDEASVQDMQRLADYIAERRVPAIFTETSVSPKSITALQEAVRARGWDVLIPSRSLFSDSLGDTPETDTWAGMMRYNIDLIVESLHNGASAETEQGKILTVPKVE